MAILPPAPQVPSLPGYQAGVVPTGFRPLKPSENTEGVQQNAMRLWKETRNEPYGTTVPFEIDGQKYMGRVEQHYHPPGFKGERKGWGPSGWHRGVSVYKAIEQSIPAEQPSATSTSTSSGGRGIFLQRISDLLDKLEQGF
jgi:hypothetical protein